MATVSASTSGVAPTSGATSPTPERTSNQTGNFRINQDLVRAIVIPMAGNPGLISIVCRDWRLHADGSYKFVLDAYKRNKSFTRFVVNIPENPTPIQIKEYVKCLFAAVKGEAQKDYPKDLAAFLSAPIMGVNGRQMPGIQGITANSTLAESHHALATELANLEREIPAAAAADLGLTLGQLNDPDSLAASREKVVAYKNMLVKRVEFQVKQATVIKPILSLIPKARVAAAPPASTLKKIQETLLSPTVAHILSTIALSAIASYTISWKAAATMGAAYLGCRFTKG